MGFNDTIDTFVTMLEANTALSAWSTAQFSKAVSVKRMFKYRTELGMDELPIVMVVYPAKDPGSWTYGERIVKYTLRLYFLFMQEDRETAQTQVTDFEELIEAAFLQYIDGTLTKPTGVERIEPGAAATDEGIYHPVYAGVKDIVVEEGQTL